MPNVPTENHRNFLKAIWLENINMPMSVLMAAFPDPANLPETEETIAYIRACRERGYEPPPYEILNCVYIPDTSKKVVASQRDISEAILGNRSCAFRPRHGVSASLDAAERFWEAQ